MSKLKIWNGISKHEISRADVRKNKCENAET